jgi:hypothetical protein
MSNTVMAAKSGDSDLEPTLLQKGRGEFCYFYGCCCDVYDERCGFVRWREEVELSMMNP